MPRCNHKIQIGHTHPWSRTGGEIEVVPMLGASSHRLGDWTLPRVLTAQDVEKWVDNIPSGTEYVTLNLGECERVCPFAEARLQGALCLLHRRNIETRVYVPPHRFVDQHAYAAFADLGPAQPTSSLSPTERGLAGKVAGMVIGQLCKFDAAYQDIPTRQREELVERSYLYGSGSESVLFAPPDPRRTEDPRKSAAHRVAFFSNRLDDLLKPLGVNSGEDLAASSWLTQLKAFAFDALENTWDHGRLDLAGKTIRGLRFIRFRCVDLGKNGIEVAQVVPGFEACFEAYLEALAVAPDLGFRWNTDGGRLAEITITDGGVGIAARMAGNFDVFEGSLEVEQANVRNALLPNGTSKSYISPGAGQGFRKMFRACSRLSGLVIIRTGRLICSRTYRRTDGSIEEYNFSKAPPSAYEPKINSTALPLLAGTSVSLIFPVRPLGHARVGRKC